MRMLLALIIAALVPYGAQLQPAVRADLATLAAAARVEAGVPALGLVVLREGGEASIAVDGVRVVGGEDAVTEGDAWHWGSITKSMTATLVARLVEEDVVAWEDTVGERLGEVAPEMHAAYRDVTFRHLLSHRAGLAANLPIARFGEFGQKPDDPIADRARWVRLALAQEPVGPAETTFLYSNNGFIVAGAMLEAATGEPWEVLIRREVFEPLGIERAGFGAPGADQPRGHVSEGGVDTAVPVDTDNPAALGPAGRVHMPLADIARYLRAHAERRPDFLRSESYDALHTPPFGGNYALGWIVPGSDARWHNGSNTTWYAEAAFDLSNGGVVAVVVNDGDLASVQPAVAALLRDLMKRE